jgi:hypothetical protein
MDNMEKLTHPVELFDEQLDLVAAGNGGNDGCGCDRDGSLINVETGNINVLSGNNIAVASLGVWQSSHG